MKLKKLGKYFSPGHFIKFKSMNLIVAICVFVIFSFLLGMPIGQKKINSVRDIYEKYNYNVLKEIPDREDVNAVVSDLIGLECRVEDGVELVCANLETEAATRSLNGKSNSRLAKSRKSHLCNRSFPIHDVYLEFPGAKIITIQKKIHGYPG